MIALSRGGIADRIAYIARDFGVRLERKTRSEIPRRVLSREPVRNDEKILRHRLFKAELAASSIRTGHNIFCEVISARRQTRPMLERLADLDIDIVADVIRLVPNRYEQMVTGNDRPALVRIVVWSPFNDGHERRRVHAGLDIAGQVQTDLDISACPDDHARNKARKLTKCRFAIELKTRIELAIDLSFVQNVGRRDIENCLLG